MPREKWSQFKVQHKSLCPEIWATIDWSQLTFFPKTQGEWENEEGEQAAKSN